MTLELDGPRLAELLLAEVVGRELGPLADLAVEGLDHPAAFSVEVGDRYQLVRGGRPAATLAVEEDHVAVDLGAGSIRIERGGAVKPGLDELVRRLTS